MTKHEIHNICEKYGIVKYTINPDGSIDVDDDVRLHNMGLTKLPLDFNIVHGHFYCYKNELTSLKGSPKKVGGDFYCSYNILTSLKGSPESVRGSFYCSYNKISSLKGCPKYIGESFYCSYNKLTSLEYFPNKIKHEILLKSNPLESLVGFNEDYDKLSCDNKDELIKKHKRSKKLKILEKL